MLTYDQRQIIQKLYKERSQSAIAREIGVHRSTVKRELDRNSVEGEYLGHMAHIYTLARKRAAGKAFNFPPLRFRWRIRKTPERLKRPMLSIRKTIVTSCGSYKLDKVYGRIKRKRKELRGERYWRKYKCQRYRINRKWYFTEVRVRNYTREKFRKELLESIWGKRKYCRYFRGNSNHTIQYRNYARLLAEARRRRERAAKQSEINHLEQLKLNRPEEKTIAAGQRPDKKNKLLNAKPSGLRAGTYKEKLFEQESYSQVFVPPKVFQQTAA